MIRTNENLLGQSLSHADDPYGLQTKGLLRLLIP